MIEYQGRKPTVHPTAFIAPTAVLIGDVVVEEGASIWFGAVLRADFQPIIVGKESSIQDNVVIHVDVTHPTRIGERVTVGHASVLEGCQIDENAVIGMNSTVLVGAHIGKGALVAAGSVVKANFVVPPGTLVAGNPAEIKKRISGESAWWIENAWKEYVRLGQHYRSLLDR
ncbi:MAG: gamma carbonic anhydrase family protein [Hydrogenibacillus schlegelii]|uniref:Gamma carbonic anhydrase family protein n=1 Tax=Hydrogenibacillus schlegelii TaxID=1484 RepID=A0A947CVI5_HYDSH|nr:gamma carbonic anhydrase family protein [Hydrogenibacillus schlegelii]